MTILTTRLQATFGGSTKVWLGWLNPALLPLVDLETEGEVGHPFLFLTPKRFVDKFGLGCADAGGDRLSALEAQLVELKEGLQVLLSAHLNPGATGEGGSGFHSATDQPPPAPVSAPLPPKKSIEAPPGLRAFRSLVLLGSLLFGRLLNTQGPRARIQMFRFGHHESPGRWSLLRTTACKKASICLKRMFSPLNS